MTLLRFLIRLPLLLFVGAELLLFAAIPAALVVALGMVIFGL